MEQFQIRDGVKPSTVDRLSDSYDWTTHLIVYRLKKHDMTVTLQQDKHQEPVVHLALGSEVRVLSLGEFTDFWLAMVEEGRKATTAYLKSLGTLPQQKTGKLERSRGQNTNTSQHSQSANRCAMCGSLYPRKRRK